MLTQNIFLAVSLAIAGCQATLVDIRAVASGTDAYNCHDNCGNAILEVQANSDVCSDNIFLTDYENCLLCAGEDKDNIWKYYGSQLTSAAADCGLSTTPYTGSTTSTIQSALVAQTEVASASATATASAAVTASATTTGRPSATVVATTGTTTSGYAGTTSVVSSTASANATTTSAVVTAAATTVFGKSMLLGTMIVLGATASLMNL